MYQQLQQNTCQTHQLQVVAINLDTNSDSTPRRYCSKCLVEKTNDGTLFTNSEAQECIKETRDNLLQKKHYYFNHNLKILQQIQDILFSLRESFQTTFNKIIDNIGTEQLRLQSQYQNLEEQMKIVDLNNFSQFQMKVEENSTKIENFKLLIKDFLEQIKNNESLKLCITEIDKLEDEKEEVLFTKEFNREDYNNIATPSLQVICQEHKKQIIAFDMNNNRAKENRMACIHCIEENPNQYTSIKTAQEKWKKFEENKKNILLQILDENKENKDKILEQLLVISCAHQEMNHKIKQELNDYHTQLFEQMNLIFSQMGKNLVNCQQKEIFDNIESLIQPSYREEYSFNIQEYYSKQENCINLNIFDQIQKLKETFKDSFNLITKMIKVNSNFQIKKQEIQITKKIYLPPIPLSIKSKVINFKQSLKIPSKLNVQRSVIQFSAFKNKLQFKFIPLNQEKTQNENCYALTLNKSNDLMIAGCGSKISTFQFNKGKLTNISFLDKHSNDIKALCFTNKNQIVSGDQKCQLIFWTYDQQLWKFQQDISKEHTDQINQIIASLHAEQIITCSNDKTIKIFAMSNATNKWTCNQTIDDHKNSVNSVALNSSESLLISSNSDKQLLIFKKQQKFILIQSIILEDVIYRLSFIKEFSFCVQIQSGLNLDFYDLVGEKNQFIKTKTTEVQNQKSCSQGFPMGISIQIPLIVCKHGNYINIVQKMNNQDYITIQSINFDTMYLYGTISSDGEYLITWDYKSKQFLVRKLIVK